MEFSIKTGKHPANPRLALRRSAVAKQRRTLFLEV